MFLKRKDLKDKFNVAKSSVPSANDYGLLIESALNCREDSFYGTWKKDTPYYRGAVVYFEKNFYVLEGMVTEPYCLPTPPNNDPNWTKIGDGADEDWIITPSKKMYANPEVKSVGIGTKDPKAVLDINAAGKGQFKFEPNVEDPTLTIVNLDPNCDSNNMMLKVKSKTAHFQTNAPEGYVFTKEDTDGMPVAALSVSISPEKEPRVGIGANAPEAHLEVQKQGKGVVRIDGGEKGGPSVKVQNLDKKCDPNYLKMTLGEVEAAFVTDAKGGFQFKQDKKDQTQTIVTFADNGHVGIATTTPNAALHIASPAEGDGSIKVGFCQTYPIVQLVNYKRVEDAPSNYTVLGTDNESAVWMTDSKAFVFRKGKPLPALESLVNVREGKDLVRIYDDAKVIIGNISKDAYDLDVDGAARACGFYIETDRSKMEDYTALDTVLDKICDLRPVRFNWHKSIKCEPDGIQLGFIADEIVNVFPEVVKTGITGDCTQSVAYQNLVPALVKAIQEQQGYIQSLENKLEAFEKRLCALETMD
jgi:Chaperone of endosialidase